MQPVIPRLSRCLPRISRPFLTTSPRIYSTSPQSPMLARAMSDTKPQIAPRIAPGSDESIMKSGLDDLLPPTGRWALTSTGEGIQRFIRFRTFNKAWSFMDRVAQECKTAKHHPEWANTYNTVFVRWMTHRPKGLSEKDVTMALFCDKHAAELGEVVEEGGNSGEGAREGMVGMVDDLVVKAGDCCAPKKK